MSEQQNLIIVTVRVGEHNYIPLDRVKEIILNNGDNREPDKIIDTDGEYRDCYGGRFTVTRLEVE